MSLEKEIAEIKAQNRKLGNAIRALGGLWCITLVCTVLMIRGREAQAAPEGIPDTLRTHTLIVVDEHGTERVRIAAPLPEPVIMGERKKRDDSISGILLYDKLGNERGGYITDNSVGNALLTLDSNIGQEVTLVAYPKGGAEFGINDDRKNSIALSATEKGPKLQLRLRGKVIFEQPSN